MKKLRDGVAGELFDAAAARRGWWIGWWVLYFAEDAYGIAYHRWSRGARVQYVVVRRYVVARYYWTSTTWAEAAVDAAALAVCGALIEAVAFSAAAKAWGVSGAAVMKGSLAR